MGEDFTAELEVLEGLFVARVEEMAAGLAVGDYGTILYVEAVLGLVGGPTLEGLAIKHGLEARFSMMGLVVLGKQVAAEVTVEVAPDGVDVVGPVLRAVVFKEPVLGLDAVVVALPRFSAASPGKEQGVRVLDLAPAVHLLDEPDDAGW